MSLTNYSLDQTNDELQWCEWAKMAPDGGIDIESGERPIQMQNSDGTGTPLLHYKGFGADIIRFATHKGVTNHTHEGDHILFVLQGKGIVEYNGQDNDLYPGVCYLIPGHIDHAIRAESELILLVVGNNHFPLASKERMSLIENYK